MSFENLFQKYKNRNPELRMVANMAYEYGMNTCQAQSAAMTTGVGSHDMIRQDKMVIRMVNAIEAIHATPVPDVPATHPTQFKVDLTKKYPQFRPDGDEGEEPINEQTRLLSEQWMIVAVELCLSQSASLGGGLIEPDWIRAKNNIAALTKHLADFRKLTPVDLPETADAGTVLRTAGSTA